MARWSTSLPLELWACIFRLATHIPGAFDTSFRSPWDFWPELYSSDDFYLKHYSKSMRVKLSLMTVCKRWHALVQPLVFESVVIRSMDFFDLVGNDPTRYRYIRRIDVNPPEPDLDINPPSNMRLFYERMVEVLKGSTQLEVYRHTCHDSEE